MKTLRDMRADETVCVVKLHGEGAEKRRIMDMGITGDADHVRLCCFYNCVPVIYILM